MSVLGSFGDGIVGGLINSRAARSAANTQAQSARDANATMLEMFNQNRQDMLPWRNAGVQGLDALLYGLGIGPSGSGPGLNAADAQARGSGQVVNGRFPWMSRNMLTNGATDPATSGPAQGSRPVGYGDLMRSFGMADFEADPGYQFRLNEGEAAINRNALARGRFNSGAALKELSRFSSNLASDEFGNAYNRFNQNQSTRFNRLAGLAGVGQEVTRDLNQDRRATGVQMGNNIVGAGNAQAAGRVGSANAWSNAMNNTTRNALTAILTGGF
jgi:hypothetical protein